MDQLYWIREVRDINDEHILWIKDLHIKDDKKAKYAVYKYLKRFAQSEDKDKGILYTDNRVIFSKMMKDPPSAVENYFENIDPKKQAWIEGNFSYEQLRLLERPTPESERKFEKSLKEYLEIVVDTLNKNEEMKIEHKNQTFVKQLQHSIDIAREVIIKGAQEAIAELQAHNASQEMIDRINKNSNVVNRFSHRIYPGIIEKEDLTSEESTSFTQGITALRPPYDKLFKTLANGVWAKGFYLIALAQDRKLKEFILTERKKIVKKAKEQEENKCPLEELIEEVIKFNIILTEILLKEEKYLKRLIKNLTPKTIIATTLHECLHDCCSNEEVVESVSRVILKHYLGISTSTHRYAYPHHTLHFEAILHQYWARGGKIKSDLALVYVAWGLKDLKRFVEFLEEDLKIR